MLVLRKYCNQVGLVECNIGFRYGSMLYMLSYKKCILKQLIHVDPSCQCRGEARETVGHILSSCSSKNWSLYKERHSRILAVLTRHVCAQLGLPYSTTAGDLWKWIPEAGLVIEGDTLRVTQWTPMYQLRERWQREHLILCSIGETIRS